MGKPLSEFTIPRTKDGKPDFKQLAADTGCRHCDLDKIEARFRDVYCTGLNDAIKVFNMQAWSKRKC